MYSDNRFIIYRNPAQWEYVSENIKAGLIPCPRCGKWAERITKTKVYSGASLGHYVKSLPTWNTTYSYCCDDCQNKLKTSWLMRHHEKCSKCNEYYLILSSEINEMCDLGNSFFVCTPCLRIIQIETEARKITAKERYKVMSNNRRSSKFGLVSDLTLAEWFEILDEFDYKCAYCGAEYEDIEHIVPISKGGGTTKTNVIPSCSECNAKKNVKPVSWRDLKSFKDHNAAIKTPAV